LGAPRPPWRHHSWFFAADGALKMGKRGIPLEASERGARGGADQFKWEDVKNMRNQDRECYLGQR